MSKMKKENGEIVCDDCGLSLGFYESTADAIHYCTTCSFKIRRNDKFLQFAGNNCNYMG